MKFCTQCQEKQPFSAFHKDKSRKDGCRDRCKLCVATYMRQRYDGNREQIISKVKDWVENNRARHNEKCRKWVQNNRGAVNARTARRYAAKTRATPKWLSTDEQWMIVEAYDLAQLRSKMTGQAWEVDHIVPLRGKDVMGLHVPWNLQVVPLSENRRKSNLYLVT